LESWDFQAISASSLSCSLNISIQIIIFNVDFLTATIKPVFNMEIINHRLQGNNIIYQQTPNFYQPPFRTATGLPDSVVIHYTAMTSFEGALGALTTRKVKDNVSAHLVIGKRGEIRQLACFDCRTWHAGTSEFNGRKSYNHYSVGIEIDNAGWLQKYPDGTFSRPDLMAIGARLQESNVLRARHLNPRVRHEFWEKFTDEQIKAVFDVCHLLHNTYNIREILGHDEISPGRKQDPGPAFPLEELRNVILNTGLKTKLNTAKVNASFLNIRGGAGEDFDKVAEPLPQGTVIEILEESNGWLRVLAPIEGWVSKAYIALTAPSNDPQELTGNVRASRLNIRSGAGEQFGKVADPLHRNATVEILEERDGWYRVRTKIEGWISKQFIL
jgi:N-acetylmuramoyl-L-alanine amidase